MPPAALCAALCAGLLLGGALRIGLTVSAARAHLPVAPVAVEAVSGRVRGTPRLTDAGWRADLRIDTVRTGRGRYDARLALRVYGLEQRPPGGERLLVSGELARGERGWYLSADGAARFAASGSRAAGPGAPGRPRPPRAAARAGLETAVSRLGGASWLARALLLGRMEEAPPYARELFRASGTAHILALSGMHLGILIGLAMLLAGPLIGRHRALLLSLVLVAAYLAVVGFRASLARAAVMFALAVCAVSLGRRPEPTRILAAAFIAIAVCAPQSVDGLSFRLSFAALGGILLFGRRVDRALLPWVPGVVRAPLAASVGAQLGTLPIVAAAFGVARPIGVVATLAMAPVAVLFIWVSVAGLAVTAGASAAGMAGPLGAGAALVRSALAGLEQVLLGLADAFARAPGVWMDGAAAGAAGALVVAAAAALLLLDSRLAGGQRAAGAVPGGREADPDGVRGPSGGGGERR
jgi:ComEC/Rec2-related protein